MPLEEIAKNLLPSFCPMKNSMEAIKSAVKQYSENEVKRIYVPATITEKKPTRLSEGVNGCSPRIEELIDARAQSSLNWLKPKG
jgi:hypothetical protein